MAQKRVGNANDPYVSITEPVKIVSGIGILKEIPIKASGMQIMNGSTSLGVADATLNQLPTPTVCAVQYDQCYIYADPSLEGVTLTVSYFGGGNIYISSNRIFTKNNGSVITQTLNQLTTGASNFIFLNDYSNSTVYNTYNIVNFSGASFMYTNIASASGNLPNNPTYWARISGSLYRSTYSTATSYNSGDVVSDSNNYKLYQSIVSSNLNNPLTDSTKWQLQIDVSGAVTAANTAATNANNATTSANTATTNANNATTSANTATNNANTATTNANTAATSANTTATNLSHKGLYSGTTAYVVNNIVNYNGTAYMCILAGTGQTPTSSSTYWKKMNNFINQGTYSNAITYMYGDCIVDSINQNVYMSIIDTNLNQLLSDTTKWQLLVTVASAITSANTATTSANTATTNANTATSSANTATTNANNAATSANSLVTTFVSKGAYNAATAYVPNNIVTLSGSSWRCLANSTGITPVEGANWTLVALKGTDGTGTGTVTSVTSANTDISVATTTTTPVLTLNSGTGANQVPKRDANGNIQNIGYQVIPISANTTLTPAQSGIINVTTGASVITVTLPTAVGNTQIVYTIKKIDVGVGTVSIATTSSQTIDGVSTKTLKNQYATIVLLSDGTNWIVDADNSYDKIGILTSLTTTDQTSLVNAINENKARVTPIANGGTGSATQNFVDLTTAQTVAGNKTFSGQLKSTYNTLDAGLGLAIIGGAGQATAAFDTTGATGSTLYVQDSGNATNNGGTVLFGTGAGSFAAIKGLLGNGTQYTQGDLIFSTRNALADTTLTERMRITSSGAVTVAGTVKSQNNFLLQAVSGGYKQETVGAVSATTPATTGIQKIGTFTFPTAFSAAPVVIPVINSGMAACTSLGTFGITATTFDLYGNILVINSAITFSYIAVGT